MLGTRILYILCAKPHSHQVTNDPAGQNQGSLQPLWGDQSVGPGSSKPWKVMGEEAQGSQQRVPPTGLPWQALEWTFGKFEWEVGCRAQPPSRIWAPCRHVASGLTVEDRPAVLGGGGQRQAGVIELVTIVPDADLELDGIIDVLQHGC